jgi:hypothetical protein
MSEKGTGAFTNPRRFRDYQAIDAWPIQNPVCGHGGEYIRGTALAQQKSIIRFGSP